MNAPAAKLSAFKAYDIRGKLPHELNPTMAYHIGQGLSHVTGATTAVLGMDSRLSSPTLLAAVGAGLAQQGVKVSTLGLCGTEEVYHAAGACGYDLGVMVTASHNPAEYNGFKFIRAGGQPFSHHEDMPALEAYTRTQLAAQPQIEVPTFQPQAVSHRAAYVAHILSLVDTAHLPPLTVVFNAGNGAAGATSRALLAQLPQLKAVEVDFTPDGTFPNGIPNPLLPENRTATIQAVQQHGANLGIAWDGDFDRCFFYDEHGNFISNYYICALLARTLLAREKSAIVHDPRLYWDTVDTITHHGGTAAICKVGHGYIKPKMRELNATFGGEISGHFYFRDFFFCDTGMLPWLLVLQLMGKTGQSLGQLVAEHATRAPASDEINFRTTTPTATILQALTAHYQAQGAAIEHIDGLGLTAATWRANIRPSSNEPLLRLNVEARTPGVLNQKLDELSTFIQQQGATRANH